MSSIWKWLLGIDRSPGEVAPGGSTRLELSALPEGSAALAVLIAAVALTALLWKLYRRERRDLSQSRRTLLVGLRLLVLVAVAVMLIEPVLITVRRETVPSHLPIIIDDSESMKFADPYTDETKAAEVAAALELRSEGGSRPSTGSGRHRGSTSSRRRSAPTWRSSGAGGKSFSPTWRQGSGAGPPVALRATRSSTTSSRTEGSRRWGMRSGTFWRPTEVDPWPGSCW